MYTWNKFDSSVSTCRNTIPNTHFIIAAACYELQCLNPPQSILAIFTFDQPIQTQATSKSSVHMPPVQSLSATSCYSCLTSSLTHFPSYLIPSYSFPLSPLTHSLILYTSK